MFGLPPGPPFFRFSDSAESSRILIEANFADIQITGVPQTWTLRSSEQLFESMRHAAVRTGALLNLQKPEALKSIQREIVTRAERFRKGDVIELPMPAVLASAVKPR